MNSRGFTVIELVATLVLIGIVSAVAISRFVQPNAFNEVAARDALLASIRAAQQSALGRSDVSFEIGATGDRWQFVVKEGVSVIRSNVVPQNGVKLETGTAAELGGSTDDCASGTRYNTPVNAFVLEFDSRGNLSSFSNTGVGTEVMSPTFNGVRICVNDTVPSSVCVSRAGFAYRGDCDA